MTNPTQAEERASGLCDQEAHDDDQEPANEPVEPRDLPVQLACAKLYRPEQQSSGRQRPGERGGRAGAQRVQDADEVIRTQRAQNKVDSQGHSQPARQELDQPNFLGTRESNISQPTVAGGGNYQRFADLKRS